MSEVRLVIRDPSRSIHATRHGAFADCVIAALSAEPETIEELDKAVRRFHAPGDRSFFAGFRTGIHDEPYDAGLVIIDLEARLVVCRSSYSSPTRTGVLCYHDGRQATDQGVRYHLSDEWAFTSEVENWQGQAERRRQGRRDHPALDVRAVLYGQPMLRFIAVACWKAVRERAALAPVDEARARIDLAADGELAADDSSREDDQGYDLEREIHAQWMLTPRDDLRGQAPRDLVLAKRDFIVSDLDDRQRQWAEQQECPPGLDPGSHAFRWGGFGTHEIVKYYDLVRSLLQSCRRRLVERTNEIGPRADLEFETPGDFLTTEVPRLERLRDEWLDAPDAEFHGRTPRSIIDRERARIPEAVSAEEAVIDDDCPLCQMMADLPGPSFWHLDGCNMDPDFAFSFHRTRAEYEAEQRAFEEFNRRFEAKRQEQERLGVTNPNGGYADPDYLWSRSFIAGENEDAPLEVRLFAVGSHLAELIVDLKQPTEDRPLIDRLSRDFGNLREVLRTQDVARAAALIEPVLDRFCETLDVAAQARGELQPKCADLQQRLRRFLEPPSESDRSPDSLDDTDLPF